MDLLASLGLNVDSAQFAPVPAAIGGALIGLAAALLLLLNGRIAGVSGIIAQSVVGERDRGWRFAFLAGLLLAGLALAFTRPEQFAAPNASLPLAAVAGLLVGIGTQLGSGCTSGHGICGLARGSKRSLVAVATFMGAGALAVFVRSALT
jgi:uncharacterized membrane protein YedE/YeeE